MQSLPKASGCTFCFLSLTTLSQNLPTTYRATPTLAQNSPKPYQRVRKLPFDKANTSLNKCNFNGSETSASCLISILNRCFFIKKIEKHLNLIRTMNETDYSTITTSSVAVFTASKNVIFSISFV